MLQLSEDTVPPSIYGDDEIPWEHRLRPGDVLRMIKRLARHLPPTQKKLLLFFDFFFDSTHACIWATVKARFPTRGIDCQLLMMNNIDAVKFLVPSAVGKDLRFNTPEVFAAFLALILYIQGHVNLTCISKRVYSLAGAGCSGCHPLNNCKVYEETEVDFIRDGFLREAVQFELVNFLDSKYMELGGRIYDQNGSSVLIMSAPPDAELWLPVRFKAGIRNANYTVEDEQVNEIASAVRRTAHNRHGYHTSPVVHNGIVRRYSRVCYEDSSKYDCGLELYEKECDIDANVRAGSPYNESAVQRGAMPIVSVNRTFVPAPAGGGAPRWVAYDPYDPAGHRRNLGELD